MGKAPISLPTAKDNLPSSCASKIFIEISGRCNAKCLYCARHRFEHRHSGRFMSPALFEALLEHLVHIGLLNNSHNPTVYLYNWGEPFLHPEINKILEILRNKNLYAGISSNFIVVPEIREKNYSVIKEMALSLSGFSQESYGRIHGGSLKKVLTNFETFYKNRAKSKPNMDIDILWHCYKFNEMEFWDACSYFNRDGIHFRPIVAVLGEFFEMLDYYTKGRLPDNRKEMAEKDLFLSHVSKELSYQKKRSAGYHCAQWDYLVVDEGGQLLLCCGITNKDKDHVLGDVLDMAAEEIWEKKLSDLICKRCISSGMARASEVGFGTAPLPKGGKGVLYLKMAYQLNSIKILRGIRDLPGGENVLHVLRQIKNRLKKDNDQEHYE